MDDPATGSFSDTGRMTTPRANHTATLLLNGKVLITGGDLNGGRVARTAEIYDPATGLFSKITPQMSTTRSKHTATLLPNGKVLVVGGPSADIYDPTAVTFTVTPNNTGDRSSHVAVALADGTVLITGGYVRKDAASDAWIYNPFNWEFYPPGFADEGGARQPSDDPPPRRSSPCFWRVYGNQPAG